MQRITLVVQELCTVGRFIVIALGARVLPLPRQLFYRGALPERMVRCHYTGSMALDKGF
jgi:hypothetical protein